MTRSLRICKFKWLAFLTSAINTPLPPALTRPFLPRTCCSCHWERVAKLKGSLKKDQAPPDNLEHPLPQREGEKPSRDSTELIREDEYPDRQITFSPESRKESLREKVLTVVGLVLCAPEPVTPGDTDASDEMFDHACHVRCDDGCLFLPVCAPGLHVDHLGTTNRYMWSQNSQTLRVWLWRGVVSH